MAQFGIDQSLPEALDDDWRHLWDSRRRRREVSVVGILEQLDRHAQLLPDDLELVSAEDWGRTDFLCAAGSLLREHYVENDTMRFCLHDDFLHWAVETPRCDSNLLVGIVRATTVEGKHSEKCLVGLAIAVPIVLHHQDIQAEESTTVINSAMLDFVCIAKDFRGRRLCPFLYTEIVRRCHAKGIHQIICTSGDNLKFPICSSQYYHFLNAEQLQKLVDVGFVAPPTNFEETQERLRIKADNVPPIPLRVMEESDVTAVRQAYNDYVTQNFKIGLFFPTDEEFAHALLPRHDIVETLVVDGTTDFISFYTNETTIITGNRLGETIRQAYVYYSCCETTPRKDMLLAALHFLLQKYQQEGNCPIDTVNCASGIMGMTAEILRETGYGPGTGHLKYYQFNAPPGSVSCEEIAWYTA